MSARHPILKTFAVLITTLGLSHAAHAGPPLLCDPFVVADEALLPWGEGKGWLTPDPEYDISRLESDTLRLLSSNASIFARMENLRRATLYAYASDDPRVAIELLAAVLERLQADGENAAAALTAFDAGFLIESFRQAGQVAEWGMSESIEPSTARVLAAHLQGLDGYRFVRQAIEITPSARAEMEFAASLMTDDAGAAAEHRAQASAGATPGSMLSANLER